MRHDVLFSRGSHRLSDRNFVVMLLFKDIYLLPLSLLSTLLSNCVLQLS